MSKSRMALGDFIDGPIAFLFTASALYVTGFLQEVVNFLFTQVASYSTLSLNYAGLVGALALILAYLFNDRNLGDFSDIETFTVVFLFIVHGLISVVPAIRTAVTGSQAVALFLLVIYTAGYGILSGAWALGDSSVGDLVS